MDINFPQLTERIPIFIPDRCPENMYLYPGDGDASAWECDCIPNYLYFPLNHSCHRAYRQGPCELHNYVILPPGDVVPKCDRNPCLKDGLVPYENVCYTLPAQGPCPPTQHLDVNGTTFQVECLSTVIGPNHIIDAPSNRCRNGSRKNALGQCRPTL